MIIHKATEFSRDFEINSNTGRKELLERTLLFIDEEVQETRDGVKENNRPEIIDGFGDIAFIAINGIYKEFRSMGDSHDIATNKVEIVLNRICDANLGKKQSDGSIKYVNGKVQKPENWSPPQYEDIL